MVNCILTRITDHLLPRHCILCACATQRPIDICLACELDLPFLVPPYCQICALPLSQLSIHHASDQTAICGRCLTSPPSYQASCAGWLYSYPVDQLITQFKHQRQMSHGRVLAELFSQRLIEEYQAIGWPDCIIPTPLHKRRLWQRGYNQTDILAQRLSRSLKLPIIRVLKRNRHTPMQQGLNAQQRRQNLHQAFSVTKCSSHQKQNHCASR